MRYLCLLFIVISSLGLLNCSSFSRQPDQPEVSAPETQVQIPSKPAIPDPLEIPEKPIVMTKTKTEKTTSPAVRALMSEAEKERQNGNLESAVVNIERALNIEPRNAELMYYLAQLRMQQGQPEMAEDLARKAELLADQDKALKGRAWQLIAKARLAQGNQQGAAQARNKAQTFSQ